jgi:hypothetical protein
VRIQSQPGKVERCASPDIDGGAARDDVAVGLCAGRDPVRRGDYGHHLSYYNGGTFFYGTMVSPVRHLARPIDHLIASWDAATPAGTWLEVHVRVEEGQRWTHWYRLSIWARDFRTIHRHSVDHQNDAGGGVATDTFYTAPHRPASAYQLGVTLFTASPDVSPSLRLIAVVASHDTDTYPSVAPDRSVWGTDLAVPQRTQMLPQYQGLQYGGGGEAWCSPTSVSMVMAYWSQVLHQPDLNRTVPDAAQGTYDATYDGTGNWPFNTAYAASFGLTALVTRLTSMSQIERWIKARVPLVISIAFQQGQLPGEPLGVSSGHLIVVRGFTRTGDVIANDPAAATDAGVRMVFPRAALERVWQAGSHGTVYVIYPPGWKTPA